METEPKEVKIEVQMFEAEKTNFLHYSCNVEDLDKVVTEIKKIKQEFSK